MSKVDSQQLVQSFLMGSKQSRSGQRRLELLSRIDSLGSLSAAAKACKMSYKGAWQAIEAMNNVSAEALVITQKGGSGGGGMQLTAAGHNLLSAYYLFNDKLQHWIQELDEMAPDMMNQIELMRRIAMKTSARNLFHGTVTRLETGAVNSEVILTTPHGLEIVAHITPASVERLGLHEGAEAYALIKASWVILSQVQETPLKVSARNQFCGEVSNIERGAVNSEVSLSLSGGQQMSAIVTEQSLEHLELKQGTPCCALVKASHVLLAIAD